MHLEHLDSTLTTARVHVLHRLGSLNRVGDSEEHWPGFAEGVLQNPAGKTVIAERHLQPIFDFLR